MRLRVLFRVDASADIGFGHAHRCQALAAALAARGAQIATRTETPSALALFDALNTGPVSACEADIIVVDRPRSKRLEALQALRENSPQASIVLIGGPSPADARADLIIRQTLSAPASDGEAHSVEVLGGPAHLLLKSSFADLPARTHAKRAQRLLVCLGGGRAAPLEPALASIAQAFGKASDDKAPIDVKVFAESARLPAPGRARFNLCRGVNDLARAMRRADLALLGGGGLLVEAAAARLPAVYLPIAEHQRARIHEAVALGLGRAAGDDPGAAVLALALDQRARAEIAAAGAALIDGRGAENCAKRLVERFGG